MIYLELEDVLRLKARVLPHVEIRDLGLLGSALARPQQTAFGELIYPTVSSAAAALLDSVVRNHPLVDGNKRLGFLVFMTFLSFNNRRIQATDDELFELIISIASGSLIDIPELAEWIESRTRNWR